MENELDYTNILKSIIGDAEYIELLLDVSRKNEGRVELYDFAEVFKKYCLIILMMGMSKRVDIEFFKLKLEDKIILLNKFEFARKYEKFIKLVENKRFQVLKTII